MRRALVVGIDHYDNLSGLTGCVTDAHAVRSVLERNSDGTLNFPTPQVLTASGSRDALSRADLKSAVRNLFVSDAEIALFYFAGHGHVEDIGGFLCASDSASGDDGLALQEVMTLANNSPATNRIIILDSCYSGAASESTTNPAMSEIGDGVTILTAATASQASYEKPGGGAGVYTSLLVDALNGAAANLLGEITPGSVYAHIDQSLGPWAQRPVFRTNVQTFVSLRRTQPPIELVDLQALSTIFPAPDFKFPLDPSFEPLRAQEQIDDPSFPDPDPANCATFAVLQNYKGVNLARPVDAPHMWHAAMESKSCELTVLGQHYWNLVNEGLI